MLFSSQISLLNNCMTASTYWDRFRMTCVTGKRRGFCQRKSRNIIWDQGSQSHIFKRALFSLRVILFLNYDNTDMESWHQYFCPNGSVPFLFFIYLWDHSSIFKRSHLKLRLKSLSHRLHKIPHTHTSYITSTIQTTQAHTLCQNQGPAPTLKPVSNRAKENLGPLLSNLR